MCVHEKKIMSWIATTNTMVVKLCYEVDVRGDYFTK